MGLYNDILAMHGQGSIKLQTHLPFSEKSKKKIEFVKFRRNDVVSTLKLKIDSL